MSPNVFFYADSFFPHWGNNNYWPIWRIEIITLGSLIDVGQGISVGPGRFGKKNKPRALNKCRALKIWKKE